MSPAVPRALVTLVLPAKDEELAIRHTLDALPIDTLRVLGLESEVVVLDGQSRDATPTIAREWGATVVRDRERGKARAVRNALPHFHGDYVVMLDADGTYAADAIPRLLAPLLWSDADLTMGKRVPQDGSMPESHFVGNAILSMVATLLYGRRCPDVCTGLWAFRAEVLRAIPLTSRGFGLEAELFSHSARLGFRLAHVPVDYLPRRGPTKLSSGRDGARILRRLLRSRISDVRGAPAVPQPLGIPAGGEVAEVQS